MRPVFANSLPKAGTNLLLSVLTAMGFRHVGSIDGALRRGVGLKGVLKSLRWLPVGATLLAGIDSPVNISRRAFQRSLNRLRPGEVLAGHLGYVADPLIMLQELSIAPLMMIRDPRAIVVSFVSYVLSRTDHPLHGVVSAMEPAHQYRIAIDGYFSERYCLQPLHVRCASLTPWIRSPGVLTVRFEDLVGKDGGGSEEARRQSIRKLAAFAGANEKGEELLQQGAVAKRHTYRKGEVDSWRSEVPPEVLSWLSEVTMESRKAWGYE